MSRVPFTASAFVLALGLGGLAAAEPPKEPTHDGKTLKEWIRLSTKGDFEERTRADTAIKTMAAAPDELTRALIAEWAAAKDVYEAQEMLALTICNLGPAAVPALTEGLWSSDVRVRLASLLAIGNLRSDARASAPSVAKLLGDPDLVIRYRAAWVLGDLGAYSSIPELKKLLNAKAPPEVPAFDRYGVAKSLGQLGVDAEQLMPSLRSFLKEQQPFFVPEQCIRSFGPEAAPLVPDIMSRVSEGDLEKEGWLLAVLGDFGPAAKDAVPLLRKKMAQDKSKDKYIRRNIAIVLWLIARDPDAIKALREWVGTASDPSQTAGLLRRIDSGPETVAVLTELLKSEKPEAAISAAGVLGARAKDAVPLLGKMLTHKEPDVRARAVVALTHLGPSAKAALEPLKAATKDVSPQIAFWATVAICRVEPKPEAVANLAGYLTDRDPTRRRDAIEALGLLGESAKPAVSKLVLLLDDEEEALRLAAAVALWKIEKHPLALPAVTKLLNSAEPRVREQAAVELGGTFGPDAKPAVSDLVKRLFDPFASVRSATAEALGRIGPAAKDAAPALLASLHGDEPAFVQSAACEALGLIQPADRDAASALLKKKLNHPDPLTRVHAALALWLLAGDKSGEKEAERGLGYRTYQVRITSAEALWRMKQDERAVPLLVRALEESNLDGTQGENERYMAARALGRIGPAAKPAVPELLKLLSHHDAALTATAAAALKAIDPEAAKKVGVK